MLIRLKIWGFEFLCRIGLKCLSAPQKFRFLREFGPKNDIGASTDVSSKAPAVDRRNMLLTVQPTVVSRGLKSVRHIDDKMEQDSTASLVDNCEMCLVASNDQRNPLVTCGHSRFGCPFAKEVPNRGLLSCLS